MSRATSLPLPSEVWVIGDGVGVRCGGPLSAGDPTAPLTRQPVRWGALPQLLFGAITLGYV